MPYHSFTQIQLDTPIAELSSTLKHIYGEEEKLIYDLQDQGLKYTLED